MPVQSNDPYIGREILNGQFKILKKIGTGGMGAVYKASQPEMNRLVAVKILHSNLTGRKDLVSRFRREARAMSHLQHPNTVKVMMYGELEDGPLYIVMEYLEGKNLNQVVRREGPMTVERAIPIMLQVCGALEEAHGIGIVHRDLKPENIFLTTQAGMTDYPKVLDFGLAKVTERELRPGSIMLTQEGMVFGTPEFMSPEQAQGKTLDRRSDIYSLATILYEALTGKLPFDARTSLEFIQLHVMKPPIHIDRRVPGKTFPPGLGEAINYALGKKPEDRYETANDFADALRPFAPGPGSYQDPRAEAGGAGGAWQAQQAQQAPQAQQPAGGPWQPGPQAAPGHAPTPGAAEPLEAVTMQFDVGGSVQPPPNPQLQAPAGPSAQPPPQQAAPVAVAAPPQPSGGVKMSTLILVVILSVAAGVGLTVAALVLLR